MTPSASANEFEWRYDGRLIVVDNGASLPQMRSFASWMKLEAFAVMVFDPASTLLNDSRIEDLDEFQVIPHALLGDGAPATLHACLDPKLSGTLRPLEGLDPATQGSSGQVLARLPIRSERLDGVAGLKHIEWLLLDQRNDAMAVLTHGERALEHTLLVDVRIPFRRTHAGQTGIDQVMPWMERHGFTFHGFADIEYESLLPRDEPMEKALATRWLAATATFLPSAERLQTLPAQALVKLAFLLDTVRGAHDAASRMLARVDVQLSRRYLASRGYLSPYFLEPDTFTLTSDYAPTPWRHLDAPEPVFATVEPLR